ncbi:hypothetical protein GUITHDRAFT_163658 [Guillardia theta CCMP2712]|uniref:C2 domain-containing protein n=1 Tax=Guillardia theta (strain CCMP2712) TaxID=905079 RepID=L1J6L4_GUITC|nr:hypothetical protein GUITHDRAFT_163658 [Guillardia theta CCMP2712]EKX44161.1 hypothetical protein GUITHDRAFT_163658 [Guillardia theta CCMP2712]|mmetsp:Transcript_8650/g.28832  ORF Transcript_8650/g.28832 Transcript_8650/m.28832 type:complete len:731 (-) Transcript_8650:2471-4663(-)|eukprot:XP_005831141.1 hypothetical protein GUITHDRAFT_163658 [Guillardia theta CCMP2712]
MSPILLLLCFFLADLVHGSSPPLDASRVVPPASPRPSNSLFDALFAPCCNASAWLIPAISSQCFGQFVRESTSSLDECQIGVLVEQAKENLVRVLTEQHELEAKIERKTNHTASLTQERARVEQLVRDLRAVAAVQGSGAQSAHPAILRELLSEESRLPLLAEQIAKKCSQIEQLKETLDDCRGRAEKAREDMRSLLREIPENSTLFNETNLTSNMDFSVLFDRIAPKASERRINLRKVVKEVFSPRSLVLLGTALLLGHNMKGHKEGEHRDKEERGREGGTLRDRWRRADRVTAASSDQRRLLPEHVGRTLLLLRPVLSSARMLAELLLLVHDRVITRKFYQAKVLIDLIGSRLSSKQTPAWKGSAEVSSSSPLASDTEFFNGLIRSLWRGPVGQMLESEIALSLQTSLAQLDGFASLRVQEVNLSTRSPWIRELKLLTTKSDQEIQLLCVLRWVMEEGGGFEIKGFLKPAYIPTRLRLHGFDLEFPMWCRVRLKPKVSPSKLADPSSAIQESPITSVAIAALSPPKTRFDVSLHGSKVSAIPGLKEALQFSIGHMWKDVLVLPNMVELLLSPDQLVVSEPEAVGVLRLRIVQAVELVASDWDTGQSDPYVKITLHAAGREPQVRKTKTLEATCFPVFNEQFEMFVFNEDADKIEMSVWDHDTFTSHDFLGKCEINLKKFLKQQGGRYGTWINQWKKLEGLRDCKSQIQFELWYDRFAPDVPSCTRYER